ncbi:MAG: AAA family ATPase [Lentisphaeria bacterium]
MIDALHMKPTLYIFSGLPGSGKTTLASRLAKALAIPYFRLDTIEHGMRQICSLKVGGEGYRLTYRIVADNLKIGNDVVVDCVNPWALTRREWEAVATANDAQYLNLEVVCSDREEHRRRAISRVSDIAGFELPTWDEITQRDYQAWTEDRMVIETSKKGIDDCVAEVLKKIGENKKDNA